MSKSYQILGWINLGSRFIKGGYYFYEILEGVFLLGIALLLNGFGFGWNF